MRVYATVPIVKKIKTFNAMEQYNFLLVDDEVLLREGVRSLLAREDFVAEIFEASNLLEFDKCLRENRVDIVLLDFRLKGANGLELMEHLKALELAPKVIVLTGLEGTELLVNLLKAGVNGVVFKLDGYGAILQSIKGVMQGGYFFSDKTMKLIQQNVNRWESIPPVILNVQDKVMLRSIADGLTTKEIAVQMKMTEGTTETYRVRLLKKIGVANTAALLAYAYRNGLL